MSPPIVKHWLSELIMNELSSVLQYLINDTGMLSTPLLLLFFLICNNITNFTFNSGEGVGVQIFYVSPLRQ